MIASDVITLWRTLVNDPNPGGRWSDASALLFLSEASQDLGRDVEYPQCRYTDYTQPNVQEYILKKEVIRYYRVYVAGQLCAPTSIDTLEGRQTGLLDQGLGATVPEALPPTGSGGPPNNPGVMSPQWTTQASISYPVSNVWGLPAPDAQPWGVGQRPRYYTRGLGVIGFVPAPLNTTTFTIDCLISPFSIDADTQRLPYPSNFKRALAWKMCELAAYSDNSDRASDQRQYAATKYEYEMKKLRTDLKRGDRQPRMPKMLTYRSFYQKGLNRAPDRLGYE